MKMSGLLIAMLSGIIAMLMFGLADVGTAHGIDEGLSETQVGFVFYLVTSGVLWTLVFSRNDRDIWMSWNMIKLLAFFASINFLGYLLFFKAIRAGSVGAMSAIFSIYGPLSIPFSFFVFSEPISIVQIALLLVIFAGVVRVFIKDFDKELGGNMFEQGSLLALLAAILFGVFFPFWDATLVIADAMFLVAVVDTLLCLMFLIAITLESNLNNISTIGPKNEVLILLAGLANACAVIAMTIGFEMTAFTSVIVVLSSSVPVVSVIFGHFVLKGRHKASFWEWVGIAMIVSANIALVFT